MYRWGGRVKSFCVHAIICCLIIDINKLIAKIMRVKTKKKKKKSESRLDAYCNKKI